MSRHRQRTLTVVLLTAIVTMTSSLLTDLRHKRSHRGAGAGQRGDDGGNVTAEDRMQFVGKRPQFARFPVWMGEVVERLRVSNFTFELRTLQSEGLVLYLDDGGATNYLKLTLDKGLATFNYKFGEASAQETKLPTSKLNDGRWHGVGIERRSTKVKFWMDDVRLEVDLPGSDFFIQRSDTFFGGIPRDYSMQKLSLPNVYYNQYYFRGSLRRVQMNGRNVDDTSHADNVQVGRLPEACAPSNPCRNNGICRFVNGKIECDCRNTRFDGERCDQAKGDAVATFRGSQWFSYKLSNRGVTSQKDDISLSFRTHQKDGLILHTGKSQDYINLCLVDGKLQLVVNLGAGDMTLCLESTEDPFNDNKWHNVTVSRQLRRIKMRVDNATAVASGNVENDYSELTLNDKIYVGGSPDNNMMPGSSVSSNFVGCLKEVTYTMERDYKSPNTIELSRLALNKEEGIEIFNGIEFKCDSSSGGVSGPITFLTSESYLKLPDWSNPFAGNIQLRFKTKEQNGLLLYGVGDDNKDHIALELYDGVLHCTIDLGSGRTQDSVDNDLVLNGQTWHHLFFNRTGNNIILRLDETERNITVKGDNTKLNLLDLHLGGTNFGKGFNRNRGLKTAPSSEGFIGCISDVRKDGEAIDIQTLAGDDGVSQSPRQIINTGCKEAMKDACNKNPCRNNGECKNKMYGYTCDCVNTSYKGDTCEDAVKRSAYDGTQYMNFNIDFPMQSNGEDLSMRFRTKYTPGLLFATTSNESNDQLRMEITDTGAVRLTIDIGQGPEFIQVGSGLDDGQWHALKISRRERTATLIVDKKKKILNLTGQHKVLAYDMLHLARIVETQSSRTDHYTRDFDPFIGSIENLLFDGNYLIDDCFFQEQTCVYNSSFDHRQNVVAYPISFVESKSFVELNTQIAKDSLDIAFNLRTIVNDGIILFNGGDTTPNGDFIAVELMNGLLYFFVRTDDDTQTLSHPVKINDNQWHQVQIVKEAGKQYNLIVDGKQRSMGDIKYTCPVLNDLLYIGGVKSYMYTSSFPKDLYSRNGYEGCFGSLLINGELSNLMLNDGPTGRAQRSDDTTVLQGCQGPFQTECPCQNGGVCEQRWNGYRCDCSATRYEGSICEQHFFDFSDGPACLFGSDRAASMKGGVVVYQWSQFPSTRTDTLNMMFQTSSKDATLVKVSGRKPLNDFFILTIENGFLMLTFNVGAKDVRLKEPNPVADGNLHYVAIKREFMNATMQVDDWQVREVKPDAVNTVFNTQSSIEIGGILSPVYDPEAKIKPNLSDYKVTKPFVGKMSRVFFNDVKPFELLHANDDSVFMIGDVERIGFPEPSTSQPSMTSQAPTSYSSQDMTFATNECDNEMCQEPTSRSSKTGVGVDAGGNKSSFKFVNGTGGDNEPITTPLPPIKLALIAGVVSAVVMVVFALIACVYCYKSKGARRRRAARYVYNIGENEQANNNKKNKMASQQQQQLQDNHQNRGDTISRNNGTPPGKDDKEYYV